MSSVDLDQHGLNVENMLAVFPIALRGDPSIMALARITACLLERRRAEIDALRIYSNIQRLDGPLLDILAYDFKVDWWDADWTLEQKRRTLGSSWQVHRTLGTKAAVETAISAIYPKTEVQEWFEYGGKPYHFRIRLDATGEIWNEERTRRVLERVTFYKSLRSHLEEIGYTIQMGTMPIRIGGAASQTVRLPMLELADHFDLRDMVQIGGELGARVRLSLPEQ